MPILDLGVIWKPIIRMPALRPRLWPLPSFCACLVFTHKIVSIGSEWASQNVEGFVADIGSDYMICGVLSPISLGCTGGSPRFWATKESIRSCRLLKEWMKSIGSVFWYLWTQAQPSWFCNGNPSVAQALTSSTTSSLSKMTVWLGQTFSRTSISVNGELHKWVRLKYGTRHTTPKYEKNQEASLKISLWLLKWCLEINLWYCTVINFSAPDKE